MDEHEALLPKNKTRVVERGALKTILIAFCGAAVADLGEDVGPFVPRQLDARGEHQHQYARLPEVLAEALAKL